jgi:hypothetical protein
MEEKSPMLINIGSSRYFEYSKTAIDEYNKRKSIINPDFEPVSQDYDSKKDSVMIDIVVSMGKDAFSYGDLNIVYIHAKYKDYIQYNEYEGKEYFDYDLERFKLDEIRKICNSTDFIHTQIRKIKNLLDIDLYKDLIYH